MAATAVQKAADLTGFGATVEQAVTEAIDRAGMTLEEIYESYPGRRS